MPITKTVLRLCAAAAALALIAGCASKVDIIGEERVEINKHKSFQEGAFLKVMAELENDDNDETEGFVYQIEWYDKNGILKDSTPWKPITIHKNQKVQIVEMTNVPDVVDYKIIVSVPEK
ncbi:DUF1425 domain-containing protein [Sulfuricurvum sp. IAE1]|uniref:DUF1425 domain-containing protein n=1 Tax=Sulfuricurvum sp. IAE1 TaxID=2546102 RepID=UPI001047B10C|nr:DUF1425 domain-containing protein [Sulfuricurvum sp. IAE1]MDD3769419.1 DUF1425 domain-containing protein [Sulfuricurvum sp.]TDA67408.1 DUF1425 domain-containing protein [Sulfuricurvum sp. IAE1]